MDTRARAFVDRIGMQAEADGLPRIACRVFGVLLLSSEPLCLDALADQLGVSKASVSTDCRRLLERGIVERVTRPRDRRDFYQLAPDFFAQLIRQSARRWTAMSELADTLRREELAPAVRERLDHIQAVHTFINGHLDETLRQWADESRRERDLLPAPATEAGATVA